MARYLYIKTAKPMRHWLRTNIEIKPDTKWIASLVSGIFNDKQGKYIVWIEYNIQWGITTVIHRTLTAWSWGRHAEAPYTHIDYQLLSVCSVISMLVCTNYYIYVKLYYTLPSSMKNRHIFTKLDVCNWRFGCSEWLYLSPSCYERPHQFTYMYLPVPTATPLGHFYPVFDLMKRLCNWSLIITNLYIYNKF